MAETIFKDCAQTLGKKCGDFFFFNVDLGRMPVFLNTLVVKLSKDWCFDVPYRTFHGYYIQLQTIRYSLSNATTAPPSKITNPQTKLYTDFFQK